MNVLDPLHNACAAPEEAWEAEEEGEGWEPEGEEDEEEDDGDDDDEALVVDGVSFGADRRAEAADVEWEALGGVPKEVTPNPNPKPDPTPTPKPKPKPNPHPNPHPHLDANQIDIYWPEDWQFYTAEVRG